MWHVWQWINNTWQYIGFFSSPGALTENLGRLPAAYCYIMRA